MTTLVEFSERAATGDSVFYVPSRLWRVEVPRCFAKVQLDDRTWDLAVRVDRKRPYERLMRSGTGFMNFRWVDAALLVDLWADLDLPPAVREAWEPLVQVAAQGQVESVRHAHQRCADTASRQSTIPRSGAATGGWYAGSGPCGRALAALPRARRRGASGP